MESGTRRTLISSEVVIDESVVLIAWAPALFFFPPQGITARDFIDSRVEGKSRLETFWDFLSETLSVRTGSVNVFSVADREENTVDIHFYVLTDNGYLRPEKLHAVLAAHKKKVYIPSRLIDKDQCSYIKWYTRELGGEEITAFYLPFYFHTNFLSVYCPALSCLFVSPINFFSTSPLLFFLMASASFRFLCHSSLHVDAPFKTISQRILKAFM